MIHPPIPPASDPHSGIPDNASPLFGTDDADLMLGGADSDLIVGGSGDDALYGGLGNDELDGGTGDDQLYGQDGNDVLNGGPGGDVLCGGAGQNLLHGGAGIDVYLIGGMHAQDVIDNARGEVSNAASDMIIFAPDVMPRMVSLTRQSDDLLIRVPSMQSSARVLNYFHSDGDSPSAVALMGFDDGTQWNVAMVKSRTLLGSPGDDHLIGYGSDDFIVGGNGDDLIEGRGGADDLFGGAGDDTLRGDDGNDMLGGGRGNDILSGGSGSDHYFFGHGNGYDVILSDGHRDGDKDYVILDHNINQDHLWFQRAGDDLKMSIIGTDEVLEVRDWFAGAAAAFAAFERYGKSCILPDKIDALVAAMATLPKPSTTGGWLVARDQPQLAALIDSSWCITQEVA